MTQTILSNKERKEILNLELQKYSSNRHSFHAESFRIIKTDYENFRAKVKINGFVYHLYIDQVGEVDKCFKLKETIYLYEKVLVIFAIILVIASILFSQKTDEEVNKID